MANNLAFNRFINIDIGEVGVENLRVDFNIEKNLSKNPNSCDITIYNLSEETRNYIDGLAPKLDSDIGIPVRISVGYKDQDIGNIFLGDLRSVLNVFEPPNWQTIITSGDGEKASQIARVNKVYGPNTPISTVLRELVKVLRSHLGATAPNAINDIALNRIINEIKLQGGGKLFPTGYVLSGSAKKIMTDFCDSCGLEWSIQDGQVQILDKRKAIQDTAIPVNENTGMIGSPQVDVEGNIKVDCLLKNEYKCGRLINVKSRLAEGFYKITKLNYTGSTWDNAMWTVSIEGERI